MADYSGAESHSCHTTTYSSRLSSAERSFYDAAQPFFPLGFSISRINPGHWDIYAKCCPGRASAWYAANPSGETSLTDNEIERAFRIRGEHERVQVFDDRWNPHREREARSISFSSIPLAMAWIVFELMQEPIESRSHIRADAIAEKL